MVFDPEKISLIVAGAKVTGYADGSKVSAEHNKDAVTPTTGIQGTTRNGYIVTAFNRADQNITSESI